MVNLLIEPINVFPYENFVLLVARIVDAAQINNFLIEMDVDVVFVIYMVIHEVELIFIVHVLLVSNIDTKPLLAINHYIVIAQVQQDYQIPMAEKLRIHKRQTDRRKQHLLTGIENFYCVNDDLLSVHSDNSFNVAYFLIENF